MIRVLRLFALLSALFVVAVRCLGGFPLALVGVDAAVRSDGSEVCPPSEPLPARDSLAPSAFDVDSDDDSDDGAEPALTQAPVDVRLLGYAEFVALGCGTLTAQRALPSHAPNLERPPRA